MMRNIILLIVVVSLFGCKPERPAPIEPCAALPAIYPDYIDVTIPAEIAPMNFNLVNCPGLEQVYVAATGDNGGKIESNGKWADFDIDEWHALTDANRGSSLTFDVYAKADGKWTRFLPFKMYVSEYPLPEYGVTYRKIAPGYETFSKIGIYQRCLSTYEESPILEETAVEGQCLNCHYSNRGNPDQFSLHIRGAHGGTLVSRDGNVQYLNTKPEGAPGSCTYGYWHPEGRYCAFSQNRIYQNFYVSPGDLIEPWDAFSDIVVLDTEANKLITTPSLATDDFETTPAFSADGKTIYYCYSPNKMMPAQYKELRYSLCAIPFDDSQGAFGSEISTIIDADSLGLSISMPRPSYDGRYIMFNTTQYGLTPVDHSDADLWLYDIATGEYRKMDEVNSDMSDGYHNWSADSKWFLFGSRRRDGLYANIYFSCLGPDGIATKPFLMPQRNPKEYYGSILHSFNVPDFTTKKVELNPKKVNAMVTSGKTEQVTVK